MKFRQTLFWDTDPKGIDKDKNARYIIERILNFGDSNEVKWMWHYYTKNLINNVLSNSQSVFESSKALWHPLLKNHR